VLGEAARLSYENLAKKSGSPVKSEEARRTFAIFGLGKFGGREMGYASDFELLFVHEATEDETFFESFVRVVVDLIEARSHGIFHIDLRLRPYGNAGTWSTSFNQVSK